MFRYLILTLFLLTFLGCGDGGDESDLGAMPAEEESPIEESIPAEAATSKLADDWDRRKPADDWEHVATLPRQNLAPHKFRMVDEWIDPLTSAYVEGKDFLFIIYREGFVREKHFFLDQPEPPPPPPPPPEAGPRLVWHFADPDAWWFQHWDRAGRDRTQSGFTVDFDGTLMPEPSVPGVEKTREYLFGPDFGTSLEGLGVGGPGAPEIKEGFLLKIYVR